MKGKKTLKLLLSLLLLLFISPLAPGCADNASDVPPPVGTTEAKLDMSFSLPIDHEAFIASENLSIRFEDVIEDSRCPLNVECIWEGRASYAITLSRYGTDIRMVLTEPGLGGHAEDTSPEYKIVANLLPYPGEIEEIARADYRLRMSVSKLAQPPFNVNDQADIYAAVIKRLFLVDHSFGSSQPDFPNLYLVYLTDDSVGGDFEARFDSRMLSEQLRMRITARLGDLSTEVRWVNSFKSVPLEDNSTVKDGGAVIHLGNIRKGEDGTVLVAASIYVANLAGAGRTYIIDKVDREWQIIGDTGRAWIS